MGTGNSIINSLVAISESFRQVDLFDDGDIRDIMSCADYLHFFDGVPDSRSSGMITYRLRDILMIAFLVIISEGINSFYGMSTHVSVCRERYERLGLIEGGRVPSHDTFRRVFELLDGQELYSQTIESFYGFLRSLEEGLVGNGNYRHIMVDGKEVRGSGRSAGCKNPKRNVQILNIYDGSLDTCIHSELIGEKTNEIPTAQRFLEGFSLRDAVVTADALHCQRETADTVSSRKGIYVFTVKDNQPLLLKEIHDRIDSPKSRVATEKRDGRTFEILSLPKGYAADGFTGMKTFVRVATEKHPGKKSTLCFMSNSDKHDLVISAIENRWEIENGFHREKDAFLNEDRFRSSQRNTVLNLAILNNFAMQLVRIYQAIKGCPLAEAKMYMRNYPVEGMSRILSVAESDEVIAKVRSEMVRIKKLGLKN